MTNKVTNKASKLKERAKEAGLENDYLFKTTYERYEKQVDYLKQLEDAVKEYGTIVTKEYVKGRENVVTNPALRTYNQTVVAANNTVACLLKILNGETDKKKQKDESELMKFLNS